MLASAIPHSLRLPPWPAAACYVVAAMVLAFGYVSGESTCLWRAAVGLPCPGCGMGHALLALVGGDVRAAWRLNPNSLVVAPIVLWAGLRRLREIAA